MTSSSKPSPPREGAKREARATSLDHEPAFTAPSEQRGTKRAELGAADERRSERHAAASHAQPAVAGCASPSHPPAGSEPINTRSWALNPEGSGASECSRKPK
jgi:hypothetical protein